MNQEFNQEMNQELFINRELTWLAFNKRVLEEAQKEENPLLERLKFLAIFASNLDEFFNVRVGSLRDMINAGYTKVDESGLPPKQQLKQISIVTHQLVQDAYVLYNRELIPALEAIGIHLISRENLTPGDLKHLRRYFNEMVFPILTPHAADCSRPFPHLQDRSLNLGVFVRKKAADAEKFFATVQVPAGLPRIVFLPVEAGGKKGAGEKRFVLLEEVISLFLEELFIGHEIISHAPYRIIRNADLTIEEEEAEDLLREIEMSIKQRKWGQAVKLEVASGMEPEMSHYLAEELDIHPKDIYVLEGSLNLTYLFQLSGLEGYEAYRDTPFQPVNKTVFKGRNIFDVIREEDVLLHHPFDAFDPVLDFIDQAWKDPKVLAIKQTLYRVSGKSPVIEALVRAAEAGKQVTVLVELKARFDEQNNIIWARRLEKAGCHVIYGLVGLKTHSKLTLILRRESNTIRRYVHLATGNYNDITARLYTDIGFFTANEQFGQDASKIFNMLSGYSEIETLDHICIAPISFRSRVERLIRQETENARAGKRAEIIIKINSLVDSRIIDLLYEASQAGVKIYLIVRGICSLRPGIPGVSENITVKSIVGRFLEHSRIYYFYHGGKEQFYLSSADLMGRNLDRRVETFFPVLNRRLQEELREILELNMADNVKGRIMLPDGTYEKDMRGARPVNSQEYFMKKVQEAAKVKKKTTKLFIPKSKQDVEGKK